MPRRRTHEFAVQTKGLSDDEAARLHDVIASAARGFTEAYDTISNAPVAVLRRLFSEDDWRAATADQRRKLDG